MAGCGSRSTEAQHHAFLVLLYLPNAETRDEQDDDHDGQEQDDETHEGSLSGQEVPARRRSMRPARVAPRAGVTVGAREPRCSAARVAG
jgi:hypothetical protein